MKHHWKIGVVAGLMLLLPLALATTTVTTANAASKTTTSKTAKKAKAKPKAKKHYLIVMGHGAGDPGARGNGTTEATFLRKHMLPQLRKYAKKVKGSTITFYNPK